MEEGRRAVLDRRLPKYPSSVVRGEVLDEHGAIVAVDGELDVATAPQLDAVITDLIRAGHRHLVIDLTHATFLDSYAMGTLLYAIAPLRHDSSAAVVLAGVNGLVARPLAVSGIGAMFTIVPTRAAAVEGRNDSPAELRQTWRTLRPRPSSRNLVSLP
jgi:anti-sigma B factor antagonist